MEPLFVRRMQHEVDICNHVGRITSCCGHTSRYMHVGCVPCLTSCLYIGDSVLAPAATPALDTSETTEIARMSLSLETHGAAVS